MVQTVERLEKELRFNGGGLHRYVEDNYFGGREWILLTAYLACYYVERGEREKAEQSAPGSKPTSPRTAICRSKCKTPCSSP
jgi:GH15 family glucan-1,4-alpha-glucosidase